MDVIDRFITPRAFKSAPISQGGNEVDEEEQGSSNGGMFFNLEKMYEQWNEVYGLLTKSDEYMRKKRERHEKYGAFRSGEGTAEEIIKRRREIEEKQYLQKLYENGEFTMDYKTNEKLYGLFLEDFKQNLLRNDEKDLVSHHSLILKNRKTMSLMA